MVSPFLTKSPSCTYHFSILPAIVLSMVCGLWFGFSVVTNPLPGMFCVQGRKRNTIITIT